MIEAVLSRYDDPSLRITIKATAKNGEEILMNEYEKQHCQLVVEWASRLFGSQDAVRVAAAAHDWDRAFPDQRVPWEETPERYWDYKIAHAINTARIFYEHFREAADPRLLQDISYLISRHEIGGRRSSGGNLFYTPDSFSNSFNLEEAAEKVQTADSISGFISVLDKGPVIEARGDKYALEKIGFYYGRASQEARAIIDSFELTSPSLKRLFQEYKQIHGAVVPVVDYQAIEDKFRALDTHPIIRE